MRKSVPFPLAVKTAKLTTIVLLAGVAAGCSNDFTRFAESPFSNPFSASQADQVVTGSVGGSPSVPVPVMQPQAMPAAASPLASSSGFARPLAAAPVAPSLLPAPVAVPQMQPAPPTIRAAAPAVMTATKGGIPFTLGEGDSLASLSKRFGVPVSAIVAANGLSSAADVQPGQKIILPVDATAKAAPAGVPRLMPGGKPVKPLASVEADGQPEFLFQSGAPFSARAAQIPLETNSAATLANADESEAAKLRKKLKQLQQEVDALEAAETKKKPVAKAKPVEKAAVAATEPKPVRKKEAAVAVSDKPVKLKPKKTPSTELAAAEETKPAPRLKPKSVAAQADSAAAKPVVARKKPAGEAAVASKPAAKPKVAAKPKPAEKTIVAETAQKKKPKAEQVAKVDAKATAAPKTVRVIPTVPSKQAEQQPQTAAIEPSADDAITTANVNPAPQPVDPGFRWPARGRIIQGFDGGASRGVKIAMPEGTPVKAARAGKVIYVGEEVKGYGKLVLVRHDDGYVSAYGNNSRLVVKRGDEVARGQEVALSGATGDVSSPMLHFELRKGAEAVNPLSYLK